ncbi:MAG TPA: hypothetical protein VIY56_02415 [Vicinamibacterales bacterium]
MAGHAALLVVHGIGAQLPNATLHKLVEGLRRVDRDFAPRVDGDGLGATFAGQSVRLYEVYWADLLKGDVTRGTFLMHEVQSLAWFPWFNLLRGNYREAAYSAMRLAWWCVVLPVVNFFLLFAYYGAGLFAQIWLDATDKRPKREHEDLMTHVMQTASDARMTRVDRLLDEYLGDVVNYVNSAAHAFYRAEGEPPVAPEVEGVQTRIVQTFYDRLVAAAEAEGCQSIHVVAHSLGTVVAYHALSGFGQSEHAPLPDRVRSAVRKVSHLYTIGCPLEKIRFFWPRVAPMASPLRDTPITWHNFVSFLDPVAGVVRTFTDWGPVVNHRLLGGGFLSAHVVYERSAAFLTTLGAGLGAGAVHLHRSPGERVRDALLLTGETLVAPVLLAVVLAVGAGLFVLVALLVPYMLSWTVRWWMAPEVWGPIVDTASRVGLGAMVLTFLVAPALRASAAHRRYWARDTQSTAPPREV